MKGTGTFSSGANVKCARTISQVANTFTVGEGWEATDRGRRKEGVSYNFAIYFSTLQFNI